MNEWMRRIFDADQANNGGLVRRATWNVASFGASGGGLNGRAGCGRGLAGQPGVRCYSITEMYRELSEARAP